MAEVINLNPYRHSAVHHDGVVFPMVYRITGYGRYYTNQKRTREKPDLGNPLREYWLSPPDPDGQAGGKLPPLMANMQCEAITRLDPACGDYGVVIVRHHRDIETAAAYHTGLDDTSDDDDIDRKVWQAPSGIFTLHHRPAYRGRRDCLLVYTAFDPNRIHLWHHIIASDESILDNDYDVGRSYRTMLEAK